jgi:group I intron endonuclease
MVGIYKITNPKNKVYVGQSINIERRWKDYVGLRCKQQPKIYNSLRKYGVSNHTFEIIEECKLEELNSQELKYKIKYNSVPGGLNCELYDNGVGPRSQEVKDKIGKFHKGNTYRLGQKNSSKSNQLRSKQMKNIPKPQGFGGRISKLTKGIKRPNQNKKVKDNKTGKIYNSITDASISCNTSITTISNSLRKIYKTSKWDFTYE